MGLGPEMVLHRGGRVEKHRRQQQKLIMGNRQMENGKWNEGNVAWCFKTAGREGVKGCHQHD